MRSHLRLIDNSKSELGHSDSARHLPDRVNTLPVVRLASLLLILSRTNTYEGRDARLIADDLTCGFVNEALSLDIETLQTCLKDLSAMGLISPAQNGGLKIDDLPGLERFCG